ncbi:unnamed protein product [Cylindrotheca closterium]|uniref:Uncharacterized protein n=1 Tax=Cylindrotheca closterium TaxID=2856 RepID=A0AAD2G1J3_9STRA|nr:unnamed protein product [Cylindrotheca closterium]
MSPLQKLICRSCLWDPSLEISAEGCKPPVCLPCRLDSLAGVDEETEADMQKFLRDQNVQLPAAANYEDVLSTWHRHPFFKAISSVKYPLLPASALHYSQLFAHDGKIRPIVDDMDKRGPIERIIRDMSVPAEDVTNFVCLLSLLTHFKEFKYGRTACRWKDYEKMYRTLQKPLQKVLLGNLSLELGTQDEWPMYATFEEDARFCDRKWDNHFDPITGERVVMRPVFLCHAHRRQNSNEHFSVTTIVRLAPRQASAINFAGGYEKCLS